MEKEGMETLPRHLVGRLAIRTDILPFEIPGRFLNVNNNKNELLIIRNVCVELPVIDLTLSLAVDTKN